MKIGLVLAGGGGKGAYHIGVWKAFREYGLDQNIKAVSGTSVGALNAALFMEGNFDKAENIWSNITNSKILSPPDPETLLKHLVSMGLITPMGKVVNLLRSATQYGVFSRSGLLEIIEEEVDLQKVTKSSIVGYGACLRVHNQVLEYFKLNGNPAERIKSILLASSAIPAVFPPEKIDDNTYIDGGMPIVGDNEPIQPLYEVGCNVIFVVHLSRASIINKAKYPNAQIYEIVPQSNPGGLISGTLDFSPVSARKRIEEGYFDTIKILKPVFDMENIQKKILQTSEKVLDDERTTRTTRSINKANREDLKNELNELLGDNS